MKILGIYTKRKFEMNGEMKIQYFRAGFLKISDSGRQYIRLFNQPDTDFFIIDTKKGEEEEGGKENDKQT